MKKLVIGIMMLLVMVASVFAGSVINTTDSISKQQTDGAWNDYIYLEIDSDTLSGNTATDIVEPIWETLSLNDARWSRDTTGHSMGERGLSNYLIGSKELFNMYDTFLGYLNEYFVPRSVYEKDIDELRTRLDFFEASQSSLSVDDFQKQKALSQVSGESMGSYGAYTCDSDVCIKSVN